MIELSGSWAGKLTYPDGKTEILPWQNNLIVTSAAKAFAAGVGNKTHTVYHAMGVGDASWDFGVPEPSKSDTALLSESVRKEVTSATYIQEVEGFNTGSPTLPATKLVSSSFGNYGSLLVGRLVEIIAGTNAGDTREITAYASPDEITLDNALSSTPDSTTKWRVGVVSNDPQSVMDFETSYATEDLNADGSFREEALFGADATAELGTGQMINVIRHPTFTKLLGAALTRIIRIRFEELT